MNSDPIFVIKSIKNTLKLQCGLEINKGDDIVFHNMSTDILKISEISRTKIEEEKNAYNYQSPIEKFINKMAISLLSAVLSKKEYFEPVDTQGCFKFNKAGFYGYNSTVRYKE